MNIYANLLMLSGGFLSLFTLGEFLKFFFQVRAELTRKLIHVGTGLLSLSFPLIFRSHWMVLLLCASFFFVLSYSKGKNVLNSINGVARKTYGALLFPVSVYLCFFMQEWSGDLGMYILPLLILTASDPLAAIIGQKFPYGSFKFLGHQKTLMGSLGFLVSALCIGLMMGYGLWVAIIVALISCTAEALSKNGWDNLTIPLSVMLVLQLLKISGLCY